MPLDLARPPIDEVVASLVLDRAIGPDAVASGRYLAQRADRFARHEIHEALTEEPSVIFGPTPARVWLISADDAWMLQLQEDRFIANWRRRGNAQYPGFTRAGGAMEFLLDEFAKFQAFCGKEHDGLEPGAASFELAKIDLLIEGRHWENAADAAKLLPILAALQQCMEVPGPNVAVRWQHAADDGQLAVSIVPARVKSNDAHAYRLEFRFSGPVTSDLRSHLVHANRVLNSAFERLVPAAEHGRFV